MYRELGRVAAAHSSARYLYSAGTGPLDVAIAYAVVGDKDRAFAIFDQMVREHDFACLFLKADPRLDSIRSDPRFAALLRRIGLPVGPS